MSAEQIGWVLLTLLLLAVGWFWFSEDGFVATVLLLAMAWTGTFLVGAR